MDWRNPISWRDPTSHGAPASWRSPAPHGTPTPWRAPKSWGTSIPWKTLAPHWTSTPWRAPEPRRTPTPRWTSISLRKSTSWWTPSPRIATIETSPLRCPVPITLLSRSAALEALKPLWKVGEVAELTEPLYPYLPSLQLLRLEPGDTTSVTLCSPAVVSLPALETLPIESCFALLHHLRPLFGQGTPETGNSGIVVVRVALSAVPVPFAHYILLTRGCLVHRFALRADTTRH